MSGLLAQLADFELSATLRPGAGSARSCQTWTAAHRVQTWSNMVQTWSNMDCGAQCCAGPTTVKAPAEILHTCCPKSRSSLPHV
eukprot:103747-Chlamydomonas_euryale.AAC.1